jgi:hypothetical protein
MDMQGYPLECVTPQGERMLVVGWIQTGETLGGGGMPSPCVVSLDGKASELHALAGTVEYRLPVGFSTGAG